MVVKRTAAGAIHVTGFGLIKQDETLEVDARLGELLLAQGGWKAEAKATRKRSAVEGGRLNG